MLPRLPVLAAAACLASMVLAQPPKVTLKLATLAPEGSAWMVKYEKIRKEVLEATGGRVVFKAYPGGVLGEEKEVLFKMKVGQVDGAGFAGEGSSRICPEGDALGIPLLFDDLNEVDFVCAKMMPYLEQKCLDNGYVALGWPEVGFNYLYSTKPVRSLADLRGAKPWTVPAGPYLEELFRSSRVNTINVPLTDVLPALQTGLLETIYAPPLACVALQWFTRVKYRNSMRVLYTAGGFFVTKKAWERVPADMRPRVSEICHRGMRELTLEVRKSNEEALEVMARNGIQVVDSSPAETAEFKAVSEQVMEKLRGKAFEAQASDLVRKYLDEYRAAHPPAGHAP